MTEPSRSYRLISADGHFNEPGDLWIKRVPKKFKDRAPRIDSFPEGDGWVLEGVPGPLPFGWGACAGRPPEELGQWARMEDINPGSYDPKARIEEFDADGLDAEVLFPSGGPSRSITANRDVEFHHAMVHAYNDWVSEFCSHAPDRLGGVAFLPSKGIEGAIAEVERCAQLPGIIAYVLPCYPSGELDMTEEDAPLWAAIADTGLPLTIHVGLGNRMPVPLKPKTLPGTVHFYDAPKRMLEFIFNGVLDRHPNLTIVMTETDLGWMPYFAEQADDNYMRHSKSSLKDSKLTRLPSEYMREFFPATFITDHYALDNRSRIGVERMLWSNDYPHIVSDWPMSWKTINASFAGIPPDERHAILAGNSQRIFGFGS